MKKELLDFICCPICKQDLTLSVESKNFEEIISGNLNCETCKQEWRIERGIPYFLPIKNINKEQVVSETSKKYSYIWKKNNTVHRKTTRHIERVEKHFGENCFNKKTGLDAGSGNGEDTAYLAKKYPHLNLLSLDVSEGVYETYARCKNFSNVHVIRGSVLNLPIKDECLEFVYSYGVLHHTTAPFKGFKEFSRALKYDGQCFLYLYEDHKDNLIKFLPLKIISLLRNISTKVPEKLLYFICVIFSPIIVIFFSWPAILLRQFKFSKSFSEKIPFNFSTGLFSLRADLYDRFSAPREFRFSKETIIDWYEKENFENITVDKFKDIAGWMSKGEK